MSLPKYNYAGVTTNFELEPVLEDYFQKYPNGQYMDYKIVLRAENEHAEGQYSYLIVFTVNREPKQSHTSFYDFLRAYCTYADQLATLRPVQEALPQIGERSQHAHTFGTRKKDNQ